ncbi:hypothetical protein [Dyadobacter sp. 22481]|uniref:hypothetical protein n=1 Tax=Dyadobacter sp. 22481 TaxID=3453926 RepID=UPI003F83AE3B
MAIEEIFDTVYRYYPKNRTIAQFSEPDTSPEFQRRKDRCEEANLNESANWEAFKSALNQYLHLINSGAADYTRFGFTPSYLLEIGLGKIRNSDGLLKNQKLVYVVISIIVPFWCFRFYDETTEDNWRYSTKDSFEADFIDNLSKLIEKYFPQHKLMPEEVAKTTVAGIITENVGTRDATIFETVFVD